MKLQSKGKHIFYRIQRKTPTKEKKRTITNIFYYTMQRVVSPPEFQNIRFPWKSPLLRVIGNNIHFLTITISIISTKVTITELTHTRYHTEFFIQSNINFRSDDLQRWETFANTMDSLWSLKLNHTISILKIVNADGCNTTRNENFLQR